MSGNVVSKPPLPHSCAPGSEQYADGYRQRWGSDGMVVECECGKTWIYDSTRSSAAGGWAYGLNPDCWRRERRRERRRRLRAETERVPS